MTGHLRERRLLNGTLLSPTPRVLLLNGAPQTFERDAWIALLEVGGNPALTHDTALALWGIPGFERRPIHVTRDRNCGAREMPNVVVHRSHIWLPHHAVRLNRLPVATPTRALFDLANEGKTHPKKLERAVNNAWARGLTSGERLVTMETEWCERGRRGSAFFHEYLKSHPIAWEPPASNLEARFSQLVVDAGMPEPKRQRDLGDELSWIGRVDMLDPELPLVAEIDSDAFHTAPLDADADAVRDERLTQAGFECERFTEFEVWHRGDSVVKRWRNARRRARRKAGP